MLTLLLVTLPVELIFLGTLRAFGWLRPPLIFVLFSLVFFCIAVSLRCLYRLNDVSLRYLRIQVTISLLIARTLTNFLWSKRLDPDMYAMPVHSALVDLTGQVLLVTCFEIVSKLGADVRATPGG
jgi:solute carrier family 41